MKELTKQQRHEIYKWAKQLIKNKNAEFICQALYYAIQELHKKRSIHRYRDALELCPEIQKMKPASVKDAAESWWSFDKLGGVLFTKVKLWMLDTAIEQTKEIKPERVLNSIRTFNDLKIETYELALEYLKKDTKPYMCISLEKAIANIFHVKHWYEYIYKKYFAKEFEKNKPKDKTINNAWFNEKDLQIRIDYFNNIINELKNGTNKKENK